MEPYLFDKIDKVEEAHWWFAGRREIVLSLIRKKIAKERMEILDAGCGTGGNLKCLTEFGNVTGMDYDETALALASKKGQIVKGSLPDALPFSESSFDLITLLDVLEHLDEDENALQALHRLLKPGGFLLITVPAFRFLWSGHDEVNHHKRRYTIRALREKIHRSNFQCIYISYFNIYLFPLIALSRLLKRKKIEDDISLPIKPVNSLLRLIFKSERYFIGQARCPFGVSIIALCKKEA